MKLLYVAAVSRLPSAFGCSDSTWGQKKRGSEQTHGRVVSHRWHGQEAFSARQRRAAVNVTPLMPNRVDVVVVYAVYVILRRIVRVAVVKSPEQWASPHHYKYPLLETLQCVMGFSSCIEKTSKALTQIRI